MGLLSCSERILSDTYMGHIFDLKVSEAIVTTTALWRLVAAQWSEYANASVYIMQKADYTSMSLKYDNFSGKNS